MSEEIKEVVPDNITTEELDKSMEEDAASISKELDGMLKEFMRKHPGVMDLIVLTSIKAADGNLGSALVTQLKEGVNNGVAEYIKRTNWLFSICWAHLLERLLAVATAKPVIEQPPEAPPVPDLSIVKPKEAVDKSAEAAPDVAHKCSAECPNCDK